MRGVEGCASSAIAKESAPGHKYARHGEFICRQDLGCCHFTFNGPVGSNLAGYAGIRKASGPSGNLESVWAASLG